MEKRLTIIISFLIVLFFCDYVFAEVTHVKVRGTSILRRGCNGKWLKQKQCKPVIKLEVLTEKNRFLPQEKAMLTIRITNISSSIQKINFANISIVGFVESVNKGLFIYKPAKKLERNVKLKKDEFLTRDIVLNELYAFEKSEILKVYAYYHQRKETISSNLLTLSIDAKSN